MSRKDTFHDIVRRALEKDGWTITHDPLYIDLTDVEVQIDLGAERLIAAERNNQTIAVEIKSFIRGSNLSEFHVAVGQFMNYRFTLKKVESNRILYLAVPAETYTTFFQKETIKEMCQEYNLKLVIYETQSEEIIQWIN
jgi:XisH protein